MDANPPALPNSPTCERLALVLQGGGALGAYQAGAYQALHEAGLEPDWVAGVSIGGINGAIIAGNPPERRLERLTRFWEMVSSRPDWWPSQDGNDIRKQRNLWSSFLTVLQGVPGFFDVNLPGPWLSPRGSAQATAFYDTAKLGASLLELVDFDLLNSGRTRFAAGAVNVATGNFAYFDNTRTRVTVEHIMASGALPPGLPMVRIGTGSYWDGGLVSNTPLQHLLDNIGSSSATVFQVDLFSARGAIPRDMLEVLGRAKDIQYSSRTRLTTDHYRQLHEQKLQIRSLLARLPDESLSVQERQSRDELAQLPRLNVLQLIYQQAAYEGEARDYEFSATSMREHWVSGHRDTERTLARKEWLRMPAADSGIVTHDIHRAED